MEEGRADKCRKFVTPWKKAAQSGGGSGGWSSDVTALFPQPPQMSPQLSSLSPRITQGVPNVQGGLGKKRKSPCVSMPLFRSPLSKMLLSPRIQLPGIRTRSPRVHIDINVELEEENAESGLDPDANPIDQENAENGLDPDADAIAQENVESGLDPDVNPIDQENAYSGLNPDVGPVAQENAHRNVVPNDKRRAIFDVVLAKARNENLKGHKTTEVSVKFSVPIRTIQRIWKKGNSCLDHDVPIDVTSGRFKCGRKKIELDVSTLKDIPMSSRTTIADMAAHFHVSNSKVDTMKKDGAIKRVSSNMRPYLTQQNKIDRLKWCLSMLDPRSVPHDPIFKTLFDYIFIDEKWYNITRKTE